MVISKNEVKRNVDDWVDIQTSPFTTRDLQNHIKESPHNRISLTPQRLQQYIRQTGKAEFDKSNKEWIPEIKPTIKI